MAKGNFLGPVHTAWMPNGRDMLVEYNLIYIDSTGKKWVAPGGSIVNGASIPRLLWRAIGSPFVGKYRRASVIHDVYCDIKTRPWKDVHRCFLEMMETDGVSRIKRRVMFMAVWAFGPRWPDPVPVVRNAT